MELVTKLTKGKPQKSAGVKQKTRRLPSKLSATFDIFHFFLVKKKIYITSITQNYGSNRQVNTGEYNNYGSEPINVSPIPSVKAHVVHLIAAAVQSDVARRANLASLI